MPNGGSSLSPPKVLQALGIALVLCYVAVSRARGAGTARTRPGSRRQRCAKDLKRKRPAGIQAEVCEGLAELIRDQEPPPEEAMAEPSVTREELAQGLLVVVVIGPASTKVYQVGSCVLFCALYTAVQQLWNVKVEVGGAI